MTDQDDGLRLLAYLGLASLVKHAVILWADRMASCLTGRVLVGKVADLIIHPVKSMGAIHLTQVECTKSGLRSPGGVMDRHFVVVSPDKPEGLTAKFTPLLASVHTEINDRVVTLKAKTKPDLGEVKLDCDVIPSTGTTIENVVIHGVEVEGVDCGAQAGSFLDGLLGQRGHRLMFCGPNTERREVKVSTANYREWTIDSVQPGNKVGYQECTQLLLMTQESLDDLNSRLDFNAHIDRFCANIVACDVKPYDEDTWSEVYIGNCKLSLVKLCGRCLMTCADPNTGIMDGKGEPLKTLQSYRMVVPTFGPCLGVNLVVDRPGVLRVGDPIYAARGPIKLQP